MNNKDIRKAYEIMQNQYVLRDCDRIDYDKAMEALTDILSEFEPQVVKKRQKDISDIDRKIISMYAKGLRTK